MPVTCPQCRAAIPDGSSYCTKCGAAAPTQETEVRTETFDASSTTPSVMDRLGRALGPNYEVRSLVGRGGFAEVYEVWDGNLERRLAAKVLNPDIAWTPGNLERFKQEARTVARLNDPAILPIHFVGDVEGLAYYVMPFVEGTSLADLIAGGGPMPPEEAVPIAKTVLQALAHAHSVGLIHRDIKPDNVMLESGTGKALLVDFGIAKILDPEKASNLTQAGFTIGTPHYMSPEQALAQPIDARSDLYSLGAMLFEMVTGEKPFEADTSQEVVSMHVTEPPRHPSEVKEGIPEPLSAVILRCLEKTPLDRFQSAEEVLEALGEEATTRASADHDVGVGEIVHHGDADWESFMSPAPSEPPGTAASSPEVPEPTPGAGEATTSPLAQPEATPSSTTVPQSSSTDLAQPASTPPMEKKVDLTETALPERAPPEPSTEELGEEPVVKGTLAPDPEERYRAERRAALRRRIGVGLFGIAIVGAAGGAAWWWSEGDLGRIPQMVSERVSPPSPEAKNYLYITNSLVDPAELLIDGEVYGMLAPGRRDSLLLKDDETPEVAWRLVRPRQRDGSEVGAEFSSVVSTRVRSGGDQRVNITAMVQGQRLFAPLVTNRTNSDLIAVVNAGTEVEMRCNCVIRAGSLRTRIGYYPFVRNSTIRFFDARQGYRGRYVEVRDISNRVDGFSGAVDVTVSTTP